MHIECAALGNRQQCGLQHHPVIKREDEIGFERGHACDEFRCIRIVRRIEGNAMLRGDVRHAVEPNNLIGVVGVRNQQAHIDAVLQQDFQAARANIVIRENNDRGHSRFSSTA